MKCARTACNEQIATNRHTHTGLLYCDRCAHKINRWNPGTVDVGRDVSEAELVTLKIDAANQLTHRLMVNTTTLCFDIAGLMAKGIAFGDAFACLAIGKYLQLKPSNTTAAPNPADGHVETKKSEEKNGVNRDGGGGGSKSLGR